MVSVCRSEPFILIDRNKLVLLWMGMSLNVTRFNRSRGIGYIIIRGYTLRTRNKTNPTVDMIFCDPIFFPCIGHHDCDTQSSNTTSNTRERTRTIVIEQHNKKFLNTTVGLSKQPARMN